MTTNKIEQHTSTENNFVEYYVGLLSCISSGIVTRATLTVLYISLGLNWYYDLETAINVLSGISAVSATHYSLTSCSRAYKDKVGAATMHGLKTVTILPFTCVAQLFNSTIPLTR